MTSEARPLLDRRLIIVSGKGGVGKTSIACAVAEAARRAGKHVLLAETSPTENLAARFEARPKPLGYEGRVLRPGLHALRIDPHEALAHYLRLQTGLGMVTDRVLQTDTFRELLEAAPGWRELIILGKTWHLEQARDEHDRPRYDLIVIDAPATGHGLTFLDVPRVVQQAVRAGPLMRHAGWVEALVHDRERTLLLPVTLPEELPASETIELVERARDEIDIAVDRIILNRVPLTPAKELSAMLGKLSQDTEFEALPSVPALRELAAHAEARSQIAETQRLRVSQECELPVVDVPNLPGGFAPDSGWMRRAELVTRAPIWPEQTIGGSGRADRDSEEASDD